jgi:hypothetical protein
MLPPMRDRLPNTREVRLQRAMQRKREKQEAFERRFKARDLLFRKGKGRMCNLNHREKCFIRSVQHESYNLYLMEFNGLVQPRYDVGKAWSRLTRRRILNRQTTPKHFRAWRRRWFGSQKVRYYRHDVPMQMKKRFENLVSQNG